MKWVCKIGWHRFLPTGETWRYEILTPFLRRGYKRKICVYCGTFKQVDDIFTAIVPEDPTQPRHFRGE